MDSIIKRISIIVIAFVAISAFGWYNQVPNERQLIGPYQVLNVIDGDTITIKRDGQAERLRLIGIDTPEHDEAYFQQATDFTAHLVVDKFILIELGVDSVDKYGRTLCYVYLDEQTMVNQLIAEAGWAELLTIQPNDKYEDIFKRAIRDAVTSGRGIY